ncbi:MAG: phytanoyl-CoA dioxygenase family protein [Myxococcota bacterium]|nr:phytanoyl-CoA dioxygenase family protein [Myxococcota bacterium]
MPLTSDQRAEFETLGFTNLGPLFDVDERSRISEEYDRLVSFDSQVLGNKEDGEFPYRAMLNYRSSELASLINHPALLDVARTLLGDNIRFWWDQGINKAPGSGSFIDWHQDNGYTNGRTAPFLTFWLALDDSSIENGGLVVVPGSHRHGLLPHHYETVHAVIDDGVLDIANATPLNAKAGDVLLFSSYLAHRTVGNHTKNRQRRAWVLQYCRADQRNEKTGEVYDNRPWVMKEGEILQEPFAERAFSLRGERP